MPKVRVIKTIPIAEDGIHVKKYSAGWQGEVSDAAAKLLVATGAGMIIRERVAPEPENKPEVVPTEGIEVLEPPEKKVTVIEYSSSGLRVWQLSDELGISSARIIEIAKDLNIKASVPMSGLTSDDVSKIKSALEKPKR